MNEFFSLYNFLDGVLLQYFELIVLSKLSQVHLGLK